MVELLNYLDKFNWQTVIGMFVICWYFTHDLKSGLKQLDKDLKEQGEKTDKEIKAQGTRTDKLYQMFCDLQKQMKDEILEMKKEQYKFMNEERKSK